MIVLGYSSMHTYYMLWAVESSAYPYFVINDIAPADHPLVQLGGTK